jgi:hypothetical protein
MRKEPGPISLCRFEDLAARENRPREAQSSMESVAKP